jgi:hypothetical protein
LQTKFEIAQFLVLDACRLPLFHVNGFQRTLFACDDFCAHAAADRAHQFFIDRAVFSETGHALQFSRDAAKAQDCLFGDGVLGYGIPTEADGILCLAEKLTYDNVEASDSFCIRPFCMLQGQFQQGLRDG